MTIADCVGALGQLFKDANFAGLPEPMSADIRNDAVTGVRLHLNGVREIVAWAVHFGTSVDFSRHTTFVRVATTIEVLGVPMQLWAQLTHDAAFDLLQEWGYKMTELVSIPAGHAYALSTVSA
jgi:hypothetical protein